ncbi:MAG: hypothetical protein ACYC5K_10105, partial [Saccharofermentanales bacterium]
IYHFDYNTLVLPIYERYLEKIKSGERITSGNDLPYFSFSSMSVVLGGFVALLKSVDKSLNDIKVKNLLISTSYPIVEQGDSWHDLNPCEHVVDIGKAVSALRQSLK